ncbi:MAG: hypothetical protein SOZ00_04770 [Tidjanibacter sp.]|nr:hypothetical protein [Tidjanibacter sp.]
MEIEIGVGVTQKEALLFSNFFKWFASCQILSTPQRYTIIRNSKFINSGSNFANSQ